MDKIFTLFLVSSVCLTACDKVQKNNASQTEQTISTTTANDD